MTETLKIVVTGLPASEADYQVALNAAFAGGVAYGTARTKQSELDTRYTEREIEDACMHLGMSEKKADKIRLRLIDNRF